MILHRSQDGLLINNRNKTLKLNAPPRKTNIVFAALNDNNEFPPQVHRKTKKHFTPSS